MIEYLFNQYAEVLLDLGLHFLWQGTVIAFLAWLVGLTIFRKPNQRATIYLIALAVMPLAIWATYLMQEEVMRPVSIASTEMPNTIVDSVSASGVGSVKAAPIEVINQTSSISLWVLGGYAVGLVVMMLRIAYGYRWSSKVRRSGQIVTEGVWPQALVSASEVMKVKTAPLIVWSQNVSSPVITGVLRPMIVLPVSLMSGLPMEQAVAVLSHELAHLKRFDHLIVLFQRFFEAVFFFHPAIWLLSRGLDQEREKACDDLVISKGNNPSHYAEALIICASSQTATLALAAAQKSKVKERVLRILDQPAKTSVRVNGGGWLTIVVMILALGVVSLSPAHSDEQEGADKTELTIDQKLELKIPVLDFEDMTVHEAIEFLTASSVRLDPTSDKNKKGLNFTISVKGGKKEPQLIKIDRLYAKGFTFNEALEAICMKTNMHYELCEFGVELRARVAGGEPLITREWNITEQFIEFITPQAAKGRSVSIAKLMEALGVAFPEGSKVNYISEQQTLVVRNTSKNLDLIDSLVNSTIDPEGEVAKFKKAKESDAKALMEIQKIIIPNVAFKQTTLKEAVDFLRAQSLASDPNKKGLNINIFVGKKDLSKMKIEALFLKNVPFEVVLSYICNSTNTRFIRKGRSYSIVSGEE